MPFLCRCRKGKKRRITLASIFYFLFVCEVLTLICLISMSAKDTFVPVIEHDVPVVLSSDVDDNEVSLQDRINAITKGFHGVKKANVAKMSPHKKPYKGLSYVKNFSYPLDINLTALVESIILKNVTTKIAAINPHPYKYTLLPPNKCNFSSDTNEYNVIIIVKSDILNFDRRQAIRETWGNISQSLDIPIVFLLGVQNKSISKEEKLYEDIVQENFIDDYRNNTLKTIMGFNWAIEFCSSAKYLFFVDDDYFVNVANVAKLPKRYFKKRKLVYTGSFSKRSVPYRGSGSKWDITWNEYPFDYWPPYIMGGAYLTSMDTAIRLKEAFPYVKPLHIDDAYLGIVSRKLNINPFPGGGFFSGKKRKTNVLNIIASHGFSNVSYVYEAWKKMSQKAPKRVN